MKRHLTILIALGVVALLVGSGATCGKKQEQWDDVLRDNPDILPPSDEYVPGEDRLVHPVPKPIDLLLPKTIAIHPFTGTQTADKKGQPLAIEVRIKAVDSFGDPTKAFGRFRFSLHTHQKYSISRRGNQLAVWEERLLDPEKNRRHWDPISQTYKFNLQWDRKMTPGTTYVLEAYFISPFTQQLFDERVFVAGR